MITGEKFRNILFGSTIILICIIGYCFVTEVYIPTKPEPKMKTLLIPNNGKSLIISPTEQYLFMDIPNHIHLENVESFNVHLKTDSGVFSYEEKPILSRLVNNTVYLLFYPSGGEITGVSIHYTEQPKE